jgi:N-acetylglucosaminyl-diphospho-decaprenol L-rhamnosyltransferase
VSRIEAKSPIGLGEVSVVIPHYGSPAGTLKLVEILRRQRASRRLQLIVSDDCSPEPFPMTPGVQSTRTETNGGFGAAVNAGVALAEHEFLLILNSDIEVGETFVEDLIRAAQPWMPAVVSPHVVGADGHRTWTGRHFPCVRHQFVEWLTPLARIRDHRWLHEWVGHDTAAPEGTTSVVDWVVGAVLLMPTAEFRAVGGFDERFFMNSEEVDLQRRLRARGVPSVLLAAPVAVHEGGGSSDPARRRAWLVRSRMAYADKWGSRRRLQWALALATVLNLCWNSGRLLLGRPARPWRTARDECALIMQRTQG